MLQIAGAQMVELSLANQRVLIREDFNVPMQDGNITDDARIRRAIPTLRFALAAGARVIVASHLGRPTEGHYAAQYSLAPVAAALSQLLQQPVPLVSDWQQGVTVAAGSIVLLENVRFNVGEAANDTQLAKAMAALCDIFVMDAFATAHRAQASTVGVAQYAPRACAGPLLVEELTALTQAFDHPARPMAAVVGGAKVSTKIHLLEALLDKVDLLLVGGGIANTFLRAAGYPIGQSLHEPDWVGKAQALLAKAQAKGVRIPLPEDVIVAPAMRADAVASVKPLHAVTADESIFDVGPATQASYAALFHEMQTIVWNGPVGVFEIAAFSGGTQALAIAIAQSAAYSLAGGGDTLAALAKFHCSDKISYISTGGGAFLEYLEGRPLPALAILQARVHNKE